MVYFIAWHGLVFWIPAPDNKDILAFFASRPDIGRVTRTHDFSYPPCQLCCHHPAFSRFATCQTAFYGGLLVKHDDNMAIPDDQIKRLKQHRNFCTLFAGDRHTLTKRNQL